MRDTLPTLLQSLDIGVWLATLPLQYVEPDPIAAGQFGISSAGPIDFEAFLERVDEKDRERFRSAVEQCTQTRELIDVEFRIAGAARCYRALGRVNGPDRLEWITIEAANRYQQYETAVRSERELREVLERVSDGFTAVDRDWRYVYVNSAAAALIGKHPSELTGKVIWDVFPEAISTPFYVRLHEALKTQQPVELEEYYEPLKRWIALRAFPSTQGLSIVSHDVTTRRESHDALRQNEEQFRRLADSMPVLAWMADANGWIYWFNKRWYAYTGSTPEQMEGWGWRSVHDPEQVEQVVERWTSSILTGEPFEMVFPLRSRSGEFRQFLTRGEPVRDAEGNIFRWFGTNTDVTDQERQAETARRDQQRLEAALEASRTGTFHWALRSNNLEWDDNLDRLIGARAAPGERTLQRFLEAVNAEDFQAVVHAFHESASSGQDLDLEFRVRQEDGGVHWLYARGRVTSGTGQSGWMTGACVDITERKSAVDQVRQRARLAALGADIGNALTTSVHLDEMLNSSCAAIVRHLDASFARIWTLNEAEQVLELQASAGLYTHVNGSHARVPVGKFKIGKIAEERLPHLTNDVQHDPRLGDRQWAVREGMVAFAGYPLIVEDDLIGVLALFAKHKLQQDTLEAMASVANSIALGIRRKHTEAELIRAKNDAQAASQAKSHFLASMSHELRTPLNAIIGYSEMLQEEAEELGAESMIRDLGKIHSAGRHLLGIVSDILDLSKIEAGRMDLFFESFDIRGMIQDVANVVDPLVRKNGNTLTLNVPDLGQMEADLTKVRQAVLNLLSNAAKFTENGSVVVEASADRNAANGMDQIRISIADTGRGIPADKLSDLFQPFSQVDRHSARAPGGTGLGLVITRRFCQMMGGDVTVESDYGKGSRFTIVLPRNARAATGSDAHSDVAITSDTAVAANQMHESASAADNRTTVLVIDDDAAARELMFRYLSKEQFRVLQAANGEEGLKLARQVQPDVITLDVLMPGMDGWTVLQTLKADPELAHIPVVMATMVSDRGLGYALGATDYLLKPVSRDKLITLLRKHVSRVQNCRVLVVEDDDAARSMLQTMLQREGWVVDTAADGAQGLARMELPPAPGLVLLDLIMPNVDGFEFAEAVRKRPEWKSIPIVVLTAQDLTAEDRERLRMNVERILTKGGQDKEKLLQEIRQLVAACVRNSSAAEANRPGVG